MLNQKIFKIRLLFKSSQQDTKKSHHFLTAKSTCYMEHAIQSPVVTEPNSLTKNLQNI